MALVIADITISLDGFVTGPNAGPANGLGDGGKALHTWAFSDDPVDAAQLASGTARSGAVVLGRHLFDVVDGPGGWNEEVGYGAREVGKPAFVVVTSTPPATTRLPFWEFVTTGLRDAVARARDLADAASAAVDEPRHAVLMGGGATIGSALAAGLVDRLHLHISPLVLGGGTPLFAGVDGAPVGPVALVQRDSVASSTATHVTYDVVR